MQIVVIAGTEPLRRLNLMAFRNITRRGGSNKCARRNHPSKRHPAAQKRSAAHRSKHSPVSHIRGLVRSSGVGFGAPPPNDGADEGQVKPTMSAVACIAVIRSMGFRHG